MEREENKLKKFAFTDERYRRDFWMMLNIYFCMVKAILWNESLKRWNYIILFFTLLMESVSFNRPKHTHKHKYNVKGEGKLFYAS